MQNGILDDLLIIFLSSSWHFLMYSIFLCTIPEYNSVVSLLVVSLSKCNSQEVVSKTMPRLGWHNRLYLALSEQILYSRSNIREYYQAPLSALFLLAFSSTWAVILRDNLCFKPPSYLAKGYSYSIVADSLWNNDTISDAVSLALHQAAPKKLGIDFVDTRVDTRHILSTWYWGINNLILIKRLSHQAHQEGINDAAR